MKQFLGDLLVNEKVITRGQLEEAINSQVIFGGRLGTNLVELGYLNEETLNRYLSKKHGVKFLDLKEVMAISPEVIKLLPKNTAVKHRAVPVSLSGKKLSVMMMDPDNLAAIDEIGFSTGMTVIPLAGSESTIYFLLDKYFGIKRDLRYVSLSKSDREVFMKTAPTLSPEGKFEELKPAAKQPAAIPGKTPAGKPELHEQPKPVPSPAPGKAKPIPRETGDLMPEDQFIVAMKREKPAGQRPPAPPPEHEKPKVEQPAEVIELVQEIPLPSSPIDFNEAMLGISSAADRDQIGRVVLRFAVSSFRRAALFAVRLNNVYGWDAIGEKMDRNVVSRIVLPLRAPSVFNLVVTTNSHFLGALARNDENILLLKLLGKVLPKTVFLMPIMAQGKTVYVLYGDNGHKEYASTDVGELLIIAQRIPAAIDNLIIKRKKEYRLI